VDGDCLFRSLSAVLQWWRPDEPAQTAASLREQCASLLCDRILRQAERLCRGQPITDEVVIDLWCSVRSELRASSPLPSLLASRIGALPGTNVYVWLAARRQVRLCSALRRGKSNSGRGTPKKQS
jgi:hypothetical protein